MALHSLYCADVPLKSARSLSHDITGTTLNTWLGAPYQLFLHAIYLVCKLCSKPKQQSES